MVQLHTNYKQDKVGSKMCAVSKLRTKQIGTLKQFQNDPQAMSRGVEVPCFSALEFGMF